MMFCIIIVMKSKFLDNELVETLVERTSSQYLQEYIGQDKVKNQLKDFIEAVAGEALDLYSDLPGLGKTTMAFVVPMN